MNNRRMVKITISKGTADGGAKAYLMQGGQINQSNYLYTYPGDTIMAIEIGNGTYKIINYHTSNESGVNRAKTGTAGATVVGRYLMSSESRSFSINPTDILVDIDTFVDDGTSTNSTRTDTSGNASATESLNCQYQTNATTTKNKYTGRLQPATGNIGALDAAGDSVTNVTTSIRKTADYTYTQTVNGAVITYNTDFSGEIGISGVEELRITDITGVLGVPHQFTGITDPRLSNKMDKTSMHYLGRSYASHIIKNMPLLIVTPGNVRFSLASTKQSRSNMLAGILNGAFESNIGGGLNLVNEIASSVSGIGDNNPGKYTGKYYQLEYAAVEYFEYVSIMLRAASHFLDIEHEKLNNRELGSFNWRTDSSASLTNQDDIVGNRMLNDISRLISGIGSFGNQSIAIYGNCGETVQDSFSNDTTQSSLANSLNSISDQVREFKFLGGGFLGDNTVKSYDAMINGIGDPLQNATKSDYTLLGALNNVVTKAQTILTGGRLIFPDIWANSAFGRSYSVSMKLVSPSGDKLSIFLNILVPIYHILGFTLPRQSTDAQGYREPFLVRMYYRGMFHIDIGIISGLSITKGAEGEWTKDGLPTVAEVQFDIKDMYQSLPMSNTAVGLFSNIEELDYIANSCAININTNEQTRALSLYKAVFLGDYGKTAIRDYIDNDIVGRFTQWSNNAMNRVFGFNNWL